jgi:hypothetical protein
VATIPIQTVVAHDVSSDTVDYHQRQYYSKVHQQYNVAFEIIGGDIRCELVELKVKAEQIRRPGLTRMEALAPLLAEAGIELGGACRVMIIPVNDGNVIVRWFDYGEASETPRHWHGVAEDEQAEKVVLARRR